MNETAIAIEKPYSTDENYYQEIFRKLDDKKQDNKDKISPVATYTIPHARWNDNVKAMQWIIDKKNNIRLLIRLPQSGKTGIMLNKVTEFIETYDNALAIVVCDNSLLLTTQTRGRAGNQQSVKIGSISSNANGYCKWKGVRSFDNPKTEKCGNDPNEDEVKMVAEINKKETETLEKRVRQNDINTLVMCSNKTRWKDIGVLINMFKSTHKIVIWIDEADKTIGGIDSNSSGSEDKIKILKDWSNTVESINLITATPFTPKRNWSTLSWIGNHFSDNMELVKVPEIVGINYHHLYNSHYHQQEKESGDSQCEYARKYLDKNPAYPGDMFIIPGTNLQKSHDEIKNMCLSDSRFDYVIVLNSKTKSIIDNECEAIIEYKKINEDTKVEETITMTQSIKTEEVSIWLSKWYNDENIENKKVAIVGYFCISRGITISSNICKITHIIFSTDNINIREDDQLLSRICGYHYTNDTKPIVVCEKYIWDNVSKYQKVIIKLTELAMSDNRNLTTEKLNSIMKDSCKIEYENRKHKIFEKYNDAIDFKKSLGSNTYKKDLSENDLKAPNTLLDKDGNNPNIDSLIQRWYGIDSKSPIRLCPLDSGKFCVYWNSSLINTTS